MSAPRISAEEFKRRYLATLRQQIAIDSKNYSANELFKQTAQPSQIEDNRSITEKVADEQRLNQILKRELAKITDLGSANEIVNKLALPDKQFLLTQFGAFADEASRRFRFGFTYDIFRDFFDKFQQNVISTGGLGATPEQIAETVVAEEEAQKELGAVEGSAEATGEYESKLSIDEANIDILSDGEWRSMRPRIVKEIKRQLREEPLTVPQVNRRKLFIRWFEGVSPKTRWSYKQDFEKEPDKYQEMLSYLSGIAGSGIKGRGLKKSAPKIVASAGIPPMERFAKFGRYVIDKQKLKDGQCVIRFSSGACIHKIPARRIGKEVQNVLTKISGGAMPTYDDINSLTQEDRRYLYNIQKMAKMDAQIPSPDKDAETKEMEEFEKMRGQILAGNDNKDLIKRFKLTLLKFAKDGRIPRREVNEVLMEMATVGM
jgi:hypothetical protein